MYVVRHFCFLAAKMGPKGTFCGQALHKWLTMIFWKTTEASNSQIHSMVVPKSIYVVTENDAIGYFQSATSSVNATGATANFSVFIVSENAAVNNYNLSRCDMCRRVSHCPTIRWAFLFLFESVSATTVTLLMLSG